MEPRLATLHPRLAAADAGAPLACAYRPCLITWSGDGPSGPVLETMGEAARRCDAGSMLVSLDRDTHLLLVPDDPLAAPARVRSVVTAAHRAGMTECPRGGIRLVVGRRIAPDAELDAVASRLRRLHRPAVASLERGGARNGLGWLLERLDRRCASAFVERQLAALAAYDREHGTDLQRVVELALDHQNRNVAADAAFMHRNTFRRQLRKALSLLDADLECPEQRLALHLALKLRATRFPTG